MSYFVDLAKGKVKELAPGVKAQIACGEKMMMSFVHIGPYTEVALHSHPHEQVGVVLEGEFDFTIGGETRRMKAGDGWIIPGGVQHGARGLEKPALALDVFYPHREEYK